MTAFWNLPKYEGLPTPFPALTRQMGGGLRNGEVCVIAAETGAGKTSLALQFAIAALRKGFGVLICSMEMSRRDVLQRMAGIEAHVDLLAFRESQRRKAESQEDRLRLTRATAEIAGWRLQVSSKPAITPEYIVSEVKRLANRAPIDLIVLDHAQLMEASDRTRNNYEKFTAISRALKQAAAELDKPLLLLSQVNRNRAQTHRDELELSDLRDTGAMGEDAATVLLLFEDAKDAKDAKSSGNGSRYAEGLHLLPEFGEVRAADFGTRQLKRYIAKRQKEDATNATINRELAIVKRAFRLGAASDPPLVNRIPRISLLEENNVRKGFLEHESYLGLRNELPAELKALFVVGFHTGARVGELEALQWNQVQLSAKQIVLQPGETKNGDGRTLPIYGEMAEWLSMAKSIRDSQHPGCLYVFHREGERLSRWRDDWEDACKRAGVPGLLFHDLRRTTVRNMVRAGIPEKVAMQISGHRTRSIFDRYNIVNERDLTDAAAKMDRHLSGLGILSGIPAPKEAPKENGDETTTLLQ